MRTFKGAPATLPTEVELGGGRSGFPPLTDRGQRSPGWEQPRRGPVSGSNSMGSLCRPRPRAPPKHIKRRGPHPDPGGSETLRPPSALTKTAPLSHTLLSPSQPPGSPSRREGNGVGWAPSRNNDSAQKGGGVTPGQSALHRPRPRRLSCPRPGGRTGEERPPGGGCKTAGTGTPESRSKASPPRPSRLGGREEGWGFTSPASL